MKNILKIICPVLLSLLLETPGLPQGFQYNGPGFDEGFFFPIGWSADGKRLAYGMFYTEGNSQIGEDIIYFKVGVQDLVTDDILWQSDKTWTSSDAGYPGSAKDAWNMANQEMPNGITVELEKIGISMPASSVYFTGEANNQFYTIPFPVGSDEITISTEPKVGDEEIQDVPAEPIMGSASKTYQVNILSRNLGEKKISEGQIPAYAHVFVRGFVLNPDQSRIAIILHKSGRFNHPEFDTSISEYLVVGSHLRAGFKIVPKGFNYEGPEDDNYLFAIGWSKDGKRLAYGMYENKQSQVEDERLSYLSVIVHDLVKDSLIWHTADMSSSGNPDFASSAKQAWIKFDKASDLDGILRNYGIESASPDAILFNDTQTGNTIKTESDMLTVDISISENPAGYSQNFEVHVTSSILGKKTVSGGEIPIFRMGVAMNGYILNPDQSWAAIILRLYGGAEYDDEYFIVGCHMKAGFKITGK